MSVLQIWKLQCAAVCPDPLRQTSYAPVGFTTSARVTQTGVNACEIIPFVINLNSLTRSFQLPCPGGVCSSRALPSCTDSLEWEEEEVGFENCQEVTFKGASVLCGANGTKETRERSATYRGGGAGPILQIREHPALHRVPIPSNQKAPQKESKE